MSIFVPAAYLRSDGTIRPEGRCGQYTTATAPVVFGNNAAGYMQMPHTWLGAPGIVRGNTWPGVWSM